MVRQIKRVGSVFLALLLAVICFAYTASAETVYDGSLSNTYTTYFRDVLGNVGFSDHYVYFRSGQYEYKMVVGDLEYSNGRFNLLENGRVYTISTEQNNYNSNYSYDVSTIDTFTLDTGNSIVYSDLGDFPQLEERSARYEILETFTIVLLGLCLLVFRVFKR